MAKSSNLSVLDEVTLDGIEYGEQRYAIGGLSNGSLEEDTAMYDNESPPKPPRTYLTSNATHEEQVRADTEFAEKYPDLELLTSAIRIAYFTHAEKNTNEEYIDPFKMFEHVRRCYVCWQRVLKTWKHNNGYVKQPDISHYILFEGKPE